MNVQHRSQAAAHCIDEVHLYLRGSCLRMSSTDEMAYKPVSSVRTSTKLVLLPAPEMAKKNCTHKMKWACVDV